MPDPPMDPVASLFKVRAPDFYGRFEIYDNLPSTQNYLEQWIAYDIAFWKYNNLKSRGIVLHF